MILVVNQGWDAIDVEAEPVPEEQQHEHRQRQRQAQASRIARDVMQFLDEDGAHASIAHAAFLSSASISATNTSSIEGSISSNFRTVIPCAIRRSRTRAPAAAEPSTVR